MRKIAINFIKGDIRLFRLFNRGLNYPWLRIIMKNITHIGSAAFSLVFPVVLFLSNKDHIRRISVRMTIVMIISQAVTHIIKRLVNRPRPYITIENAISINPPSCRYSFPSGHTCSAFSMALVLAKAIPNLAPIFIVLASLVGVSRIYLGCHYPSDVVVGFLISSLSASIL